MLSINRRPMTDQERATVASWAERHARRPRPTARRWFVEDVLYIGLGIGLLVGAIVFLLARWSGHSWAMAAIGAVTAPGLLVLYVLVRSGTAGARRLSDSQAAEYDEWKGRFDQQLESGEVDVIELEADMVWCTTLDGPVYILRVEPTRFVLVSFEEGEDEDICRYEDKLTVRSRLTLEWYQYIEQLVSVTGSDPYLPAQNHRIEWENLRTNIDIGTRRCQVFAIDEIHRGQLRQELLQVAM